MTSHARLLAAALVAVALVVAACGADDSQSSPSGPSADDPAASVRSAFEAVEFGGIAGLADYSCAAQKDQIADMFTGELGNLQGSGLDVDRLTDSITVDMVDLDVNEVSRSSDTATVHASGTIRMELDDAALRQLVTAILAAEGLTPTDTEIDAAVTALAAGLAQGQPLDEDITLVHEGGSWLICEDQTEG